MIEPLMRVQDLTLQYPGAENPTLQEVSFAMQPGEFTVLLGANGCGKSSLLKVLKNTLMPDAGQVEFNGELLQNLTKAKLALEVVSLQQNLTASLFFAFTVYENIKLWHGRAATKSMNLNRKDVAAYLATFNPKLKFKLDTPVELLSGGEQQSLLLALCLQIPPKLLLLDEHTSALDPHKANRLMELTAEKVAAQNISCIMATHNLEHALKYGSKLLVLKYGKIVFEAEGSAKAKLQLKDLYSWYF